MSDPVLGINSIIQEQMVLDFLPFKEQPSEEYIYDKEFWGDKELVSYLLDGYIRGRRDSSELPQFIDGKNFIAQQAAHCAVTSLLNSYNDPMSQVEEAVAITINPFGTTRNTSAPFNFRQTSGSQNNIEIPMFFGKNGAERTIAFVHSHPYSPQLLQASNLTAPSPRDIYTLAQNDFRTDLLSGITNAVDMYMLIPTKNTPLYNSAKVESFIEKANAQIITRANAEVAYVQRNLNPSNSIEGLRYLNDVSQRVVKAGALNLAQQLRIGMYHRSLLSEVKDTRFKRLV